MNQVTVFNSSRYIKLFIVAVFIVALTATILAFGGVKFPTKAKAMTCNDVVYAYRFGEWNVPANGNGQSVKLSAIEAWNKLSADARRSMARACAK